MKPHQFLNHYENWPYNAISLSYTPIDIFEKVGQSNANHRKHHISRRNNTLRELSRPARRRRTFSAVVVIHEIFGLNDNIREIARRFADTGYAALAVDLFAGRNRTLCMFRFMGQIQFNSLHNGSIQDLKQSLTYLASLPQVDGNRIGAIGFCMGGSFAIAWACTDERLRVIAPFYAMNPRPFEAVKRLCPVVGSYPTNDFTTKAGQTLEATLDTYNIPHDIKIYPGTKHSFFNNQRSSYDATASEDAWQRIQAFFKEHL